MRFASLASPRTIFPAAALMATLVFAASLHAQMLGEPPAAQAPMQVTPPPPPPPPPGSFIAPAFESVMSSAFSQTSFTFDRTMLQAADGFFANSDPETRRVVAGLNSITVRNFHARDFARYDPGALAAIDGQFRAAGWRHLVNANGRDSAGATDLWLHFQGANVTNVTVLSRGDRNMSVIAVDCNLRPLDLLHLSGHFGIPKVDENAVMVPAR